jgi:hypothetical protein
MAPTAVATQNWFAQHWTFAVQTPPDGTQVVVVMVVVVVVGVVDGGVVVYGKISL